MNLGCLVTAGQFAAPLRILLIDNGLYEVTGGQPVANASRTYFAAVCARCPEWAAFLRPRREASGIDCTAGACGTDRYLSG